MIKFLLYALSAIFFLYFTRPVQASENFLISSKVAYDVQESGITNVEFAIDLTNTTSQYYATSYKVSVGLENIQNIKASDSGGNISPKTIKTPTGYDIEVDFNKAVVGLGNTLSFSINFSTPDIATKQGNVWEVNIPGVSNQSEFSNFTVHVNVPDSFGKPTFSKPKISSDSLIFTKQTLGTSGVSLGFGTKQYYSFTLVYHIANTHLFPIKTEIALPPSTSYQDIVIQNITPRPDNVIEDEDGNWLAQYSLLPSKKMEVTVKGTARVSLYPKEAIETEENLQKFLGPSKYWETEDPNILQIAKTLKTPKTIYNYVVDNLKYDFTRVSTKQERLGAKSTLENQDSAVCLEFTDLFIALARASGIPARELNGFAYTENSKQRPLSLVKDILHAWPEYYDREKKTWIMVDPTWGNTTGGIDYFSTLDFDHLVFVIKGKDSQYPVPAGGYKLSGMEDKKDVFVDFADNINVSEPVIEVIADFPNSVWPGFPIKGSIMIQNNGYTLYPGSTLTIDTLGLNPKTLTRATENIPPFGYIVLPVQFDSTPFLTNTTSEVTIAFGDKLLVDNIRISFLSLNNTTFVLGGGFLIATVIALIIWFVTARSRRLSLPRR